MEIQRGMIGVGDYKLCKEFQCLLQCSEAIRIPDFYDPHEIIDIIRNGIKGLPESDMTSKNVPNTFGTCTQKQIANMTEENHENMSTNLTGENTQSDIESVLNFTDTEIGLTV